MTKYDEPFMQYILTAFAPLMVAVLYLTACSPQQQPDAPTPELDATIRATAYVTRTVPSRIPNPTSKPSSPTRRAPTATLPSGTMRQSPSDAFRDVWLLERRAPVPNNDLGKCRVLWNYVAYVRDGYIQDGYDNRTATSLAEQGIMSVHGVRETEFDYCNTLIRRYGW